MNGPTDTPEVFVGPTLPPGRYWIGDPCYSVNLGEWSTVIGASRSPNDRWIVAKSDELRFVAVWTIFGDGIYLDNEGNRYGVDSGMIGVVPVQPGRPKPELVREVEITDPVQLRFVDGRFVVGDIEVDVRGLAEFPPEVQSEIDETIRERLEARFGEAVTNGVDEN